MYNITLIPGDGIGPEIARAVRNMVDATGVDIQWDEVRAGEAYLEETGTLIPDELYTSIEKNKVCLKGPVTTPIGKGFRSVNVHLRKKYDLYANVRPVRNLGNVPSHFDNVNITIFRENTEDLYAGIEKQISEDEAHSIKIITRPSSLRIARKAFDYANTVGEKKVTVVTKANIMKLTDGLFLDCAREVAKDYPHIALEELLIDNFCMQLVMYPERYSIVLTENLYGDILSDLAAGLIGGLGLVPGANIGEDIAIFEAVHGSAPDIAGKNLANPTAFALSACLMLEHLGEVEKATLLKNAIDNVLKNPDNYTADLGGTMSTDAFAQVVVDYITKERAKHD